jgi:hypothetical protein
MRLKIFGMEKIMSDVKVKYAAIKKTVELSVDEKRCVNGCGLCECFMGTTVIAQFDAVSAEVVCANNCCSKRAPSLLQSRGASDVPITSTIFITQYEYFGDNASLPVKGICHQNLQAVLLRDGSIKLIMI